MNDMHPNALRATIERRTVSSPLGRVDVVSDFVDLPTQSAPLFWCHSALSARVVSLLAGLRFTHGAVPAAFRRAASLPAKLLRLLPSRRVRRNTALHCHTLDVISAYRVARVATVGARFGKCICQPERQQKKGTDSYESHCQKPLRPAGISRLRRISCARLRVPERQTNNTEVYAPPRTH